jgi:hypothetical protein
LGERQQDVYSEAWKKHESMRKEEREEKQNKAERLLRSKLNERKNYKLIEGEFVKGSREWKDLEVRREEWEAIYGSRRPQAFDLAFSSMEEGKLRYMVTYPKEICIRWRGLHESVNRYLAEVRNYELEMEEMELLEIDEIDLI